MVSPEPGRAAAGSRAIEEAREDGDLAWGLAGLLPVLLLCFPAGLALGTSALSSSPRARLQLVGSGLYPSGRPG